MALIRERMKAKREAATDKGKAKQIAQAEALLNSCADHARTRFKKDKKRLDDAESKIHKMIEELKGHYRESISDFSAKFEPKLLVNLKGEDKDLRAVFAELRRITEFCAISRYYFGHLKQVIQRLKIQAAPRADVAPEDNSVILARVIIAEKTQSDKYIKKVETELTNVHEVIESLTDLQKLLKQNREIVAKIGIRNKHLADFVDGLKDFCKSDIIPKFEGFETDITGTMTELSTWLNSIRKSGH